MADDATNLNYGNGQTVSNHLISRFRQTADLFMGIADQTFLEILSFDDDNTSSIREESITKDQIQSWLDLKSPVKFKAAENYPSKVFRLVVSPFNVDLTSYLPIPQTVLASTLEFFGLGDSYVYSEKLQASSNWYSLPLEDQLISFIVKTEIWDSDCASFSLAIIADPHSGRTSGILHVLLKSDLQSIKKHIWETPSQYNHNLMALPLLLVQLRTSPMPGDLEEIRINLYEIEKRIGSHKNYLRKEKHIEWGYYARGETVWKRNGFDAAGGQLTSIASECLLLHSYAQLYGRLLNWVEENNCKTASKNSYEKRLNTLLSEKISFLKRNLEHVMIRSEYLNQRAEAQVQACAVVSSQRDNANSLKASKTALRDSNDMRAISIVTMFFLPGTFMATFFSTGFFSFEQEGRVVSHWIWLYWVFTAGLTGIALGSFAIWNRYATSKEVKDEVSQK